MELEEVVQTLGEVRNKHYIMRRYIDTASNIAKSYRYYIIELYEIKRINGEIDNECLFRVASIGQWVEEHKKELVNDAEKLFIKKLFQWLEKKGEVENGI